VPSLPEFDALILDVAKLTAYSLNAHHPRGRNKARVFKSALGIDHRDAAWLRQALLDAVPDAQAYPAGTSEFGPRWRVNVEIARQDRRVVVASIWIMDTGSRNLRLLTCWID
jgi:hypothetical protein